MMDVQAVEGSDAQEDVAVFICRDCDSGHGFIFVKDLIRQQEAETVREVCTLESGEEFRGVDGENVCDPAEFEFVVVSAQKLHKGRALGGFVSDGKAVCGDVIAFWADQDGDVVLFFQRLRSEYMYI